MENRRIRNSLVFAKEYPPKIEWYSSINVYNDLVTIFDSANKKLIKKDIDLIKRRTSERTICGALMLHLKSSLWGTPFSTYNIDVEFNRNKDGVVKTIIDKNEVITNITCDLIVHSRGAYIEQDNLIALEMKKASRANDEKVKDKNRLMALTKENNHVWCYDGKTFPEHVCRYILGVYYEISINYNQVYLEYYRNGAVIDTQILNVSTV